MRSCYITFRSVTVAQRGEAVLRSGGIYCALQRTPRWMEERGCGYCLRLRQQDWPNAVMLLQQQQVPFRKVYLLGEGGDWEEMVL